MDRASLAARIQEILRNRQGGTAPPAGPGVVALDEEAAFAARCAAAEASSRVLEVLGARLVDGARGPSVVVDRSYPESHRHGHQPVGRYVEAAGAGSTALPSFLDRSAEPSLRGATTGPPRLICFDLETTGLSGGAGTYAFLVGFGFFEDGGFRTRQYFLRGFGEERALLGAVEAEVGEEAGAGPAVLLTYNGRAFDVPLIETRYQMHRLRSPFGGMPHVDMLFAARRLWKRRQPAAPFGTDDPPGSCSLTAIERDILGLERDNDVPGWEIPARYFGYARTGDARGLEAVLEHNRLDLVSLGAVSAVVLEMVAQGAGVARDRPDLLALGRLLEYLGRVHEAEHCYSAASEPDGTLEAEADRRVRADALHWLAIHRRRSRRFQEAADAWRQLADVPGLDAERKREALEALAIHHEHRAKDLEAARAFALSALELADDARRVDEVRHRLGRLSKKIGHAAWGRNR